MKKIILFLSLLLCTVNLGVSRSYAMRPTKQQITAKEKEKIRQMYLTFCKEINSQLPAQVDEITVLNSMVLSNWTIVASYQIDVDADDFSDEDIAVSKFVMRDVFKESASRMFKSGSYVSRTDFKKLMRITGLKFRATYRDMLNRFMFSVVLDHRDF